MSSTLAMHGLQYLVFCDNIQAKDLMGSAEGLGSISAIQAVV